MKIVTGNFDSDFKQLSIYDFLESQEFPPSETVAKVDEAPSNVIPSSDLDTRKNWEIVQDSLNEFFEKPTEDTDNKPLFSVGECYKVVNPYNDDCEDYDYMEPLKGKTLKVTLIHDNHLYGYLLQDISRKEVILNRKELQKV